MKEVLLTPEGLKKLREEIEHLSNDRRREVAERIKQAREFGDITENSEYDDAKNEQAMLEHRIAMLEERLRNAKVIEGGETARGVVGLGTRVKIKDMDANETLEYTIVGSAEADPTAQKLSNESPVGEAIIGRKKGETVEVSAPRGSLKYKIMDVKLTPAIGASTIRRYLDGGDRRLGSLAGGPPAGRSPAPGRVWPAPSPF